MNIGYLSGPMTDIEEYNHPEFRRVGDILVRSGLLRKLINPSDMDEGEQAWSYYLKRDLCMILNGNVDTIILLPGWQASKGARIEVRVAIEVLDAEVYTYRDTEEGFSLTPLHVYPETMIKCKAARSKTINVPLEVAV